jgi:ABC-type nickel/cobalt efflux system permease component RcnA
MVALHMSRADWVVEISAVVFALLLGGWVWWRERQEKKREIARGVYIIKNPRLRAEKQS